MAVTIDLAKVAYSPAEFVNWLSCTMPNTPNRPRWELKDLRFVTVLSDKDVTLIKLVWN